MTFNSVALKSLQCHDWPGNVRELANVVERLCILHGPRVVGLADLPEEYRHEEAEALLSEAEESRGYGQGKGRREGEKSSPGERATLPPVLAYDPRELLDESRLKSYLDSFERELLQVAMDDCDGEPALGAQRLGVDEARLREMLDEHGL